MSVSITGTSSNVQINNADLHVTNASKKVIAPRAELSGISDVALTTSANVGLVNTAPIHTLDVGSKFFVDETGATTVRVRGLLEADTINFGGSTADRVFVSDASGALSTDDGLQYNSSTNALTVAGAVSAGSTLEVAEQTTLTGHLDANSTADIADTLTLSKASGTGLDVTANADVGGSLAVTEQTTLTGHLDANSTADIADTLTLSKGSGTGLSVTADASVGGDLTLTGALDADSTADIADTLTLSKGSGTGLSVAADASVGGTLDVSGATTITTLSSNAITARGSLVVVNNDGTNNMIISAATGSSSVSGNFGVGGLATLNAGLRLTSGDSLLKGLYANATTITDGLTVSSGTSTLGGDLTVQTDKLSVTSTGVSTAGNLTVQTDKLEVTSTGVTTAGDLDVRSGKLVANSTGISTNGNLTVQTDKLAVTSSGVSTSGTLEVTGQTTLNGGLDVTSGSTDVQALTTTGLATLNSAGVTNNATVGGTLGVTGASTLSSASITGAGNALTVTNNAVISGQMRADSGLIDNNLQVGGNLVVDGELTVLQTTNLVVDDPLIELGNTNTNSGAIIDVGMVFRQPSGNSNVVTFYDGSDSKYRIGLTTNGAYDSTISTTGNIEVEVTGNVTATNTLKAPSLELDGSSIRIEGNSIVFG